MASSVFTAIYAAALTERLEPNIVNYVAQAVLSAGLPSTSVHAFVEAIVSKDTAALAEIPGLTPPIMASGVAALQHAFADSVRVVFIIAAPSGMLACLLCLFIVDLGDLMDYRVEAPVEEIHSRRGAPRNAMRDDV